MLTEAGWRLVPWTDTLHRQVDEARTDARAGFQVSVEPLRVAAIHSPSLTVFSDWIAAICGRLSLGPVQFASESLAGCERLIGDGRAQFLLARSHPATPVRLDPALFRPALVGLDVLALDCTRRLRIYPSCSIRGRGA
jgi:DNA-binding transcriptional LysR family regulator